MLAWCVWWTQTNRKFKNRTTGIKSCKFEEITERSANDCQNPKLVDKLFVVHGEYEVQQIFKEKLRKKGFDEVIIPKSNRILFFL